MEYLIHKPSVPRVYLSIYVHQAKQAPVATHLSLSPSQPIQKKSNVYIYTAIEARISAQKASHKKSSAEMRTDEWMAEKKKKKTLGSNISRMFTSRVGWARARRGNKHQQKLRGGRSEKKRKILKKHKAKSIKFPYVRSRDKAKKSCNTRKLINKLQLQLDWIGLDWLAHPKHPGRPACCRRRTPPWPSWLPRPPGTLSPPTLRAKKDST